MRLDECFSELDAGKSMRSVYGGRGYAGQEVLLTTEIVASPAH